MPGPLLEMSGQGLPVKLIQSIADGERTVLKWLIAFIVIVTLLGLMGSTLNPSQKGGEISQPSVEAQLDVK